MGSQNRNNYYFALTNARKIYIVNISNKYYYQKNDFEKEELVMKYVCDVCGWEYDEEQGYPEGGIAPGTKWEDVPEDFECPLCSVGKDQFSKVE